MNNGANFVAQAPIRKRRIHEQPEKFHKGNQLQSRSEQLLHVRQKLPIWQYKDELVNAVRENQITLVVGSTGCGKTTQIPQFLHEAGLTNLKITCTQPRRFAATFVAARVAEEHGTDLGTTVGYSVRFKQVTSPSTEVLFCTDGMLMREAMGDPNLARHGIIIIDEAHERSIATDILLGLLKPLLKQRSDLRLVVMSATLDVETFKNYFPAVPYFEVEGTIHPITLRYTEEAVKSYKTAAVERCIKIHEEEPAGDILVFLTGEAEIEDVCRTLRNDLCGSEKPVDVYPLYSSLPLRQQKRVYNKRPVGVNGVQGRKIVVATNVAETSVTIDGIVYVVDSGFVKQKRFNPSNRIDVLDIVPISRSSAKQRAGRCGRTQAGVCFRLYPEAAYEESMGESTSPEIVRSNLELILLTLFKLKVSNVLTFDYVTPPSKSAFKIALETLYHLKALAPINRVVSLTDWGDRMTRFPVDPLFANFILVAGAEDCVNSACAIVAMLSVPPPLVTNVNDRADAQAAHEPFVDGLGDHFTLLNVFRAYARVFRQSSTEDAKNWCRDNFISSRSMRQAISIHKQLLDICNRLGFVIQLDNNKMSVAKALCMGFFTKIAVKEGNSYRTLRTNNLVELHPSSSYHSEAQWIVYAELVKTKRLFVRCCSGISPEWIREVKSTFFNLKAWPQDASYMQALKRYRT
ncbi:hypothetical protein PCE1_000387 [Barthelona sp. PCE]